MSASNTPRSPSSGNGATDPTKRTKTKCTKCWLKDYEKEISVNIIGRYYDIPQNSNGPVKYKIFVHLKALNSIVVNVRFKIIPLAGVSAADVKAAKMKMVKGVNTYWNDKFKLEVNDPECGKKTLKIIYKVDWVTSGQHCFVALYTPYLREEVTLSVMKVWKETDEWAYAHEFAHCVGLPDEYSNTGNTETVVYYKPDGTLDEEIITPPGGRLTNDPEATIMSSTDSTIILERHAWNIAIEVQELLRAKLGRGIICTIK